MNPIEKSANRAIREFSSRAKMISGSKTSGMRNLAASMNSEGASVINFAAGELDIPISEKMKSAAAQAVREDKHKYTDTLGIKALRESIAARLSKKTNCTWTSQEIAVTAGAKQALFNTAMTLFDQGDEVIIPMPFWTTFPTQVVLAGAKPIFVDTSKNHYDLTFEDIAEKVTGATKGIILNTPNNPTGKIINPDVLRKIADLALQNNLWVIFDQCYGDFVHDGGKHINILQVCGEIRRNLVIIDSFSKSHAIAGWRVGYAAGSPELIKALANLQSHTTSNPNSIAQQAVMAVLENEDVSFHGNVERHLKSNRELGMRILGNLKDVRLIPPDGGFYFYLDVEKKLDELKKNGRNPFDNDQLVNHLLYKAHVALVGGNAFGDKNGIRLSYAIDTQDLKTGLDRLVSCLNSLD